MKHIDQKIIEKILQVKELADKWHKGEADAARIILHKLLLKHNLTVEELNRITDKKIRQRKEGKTYGVLVMKVIGGYLGYDRAMEAGKGIYMNRSGWFESCIELYDYEVIELEIMIKWYKSLYRREMASFKKMFGEAFFTKHHLGAHSPNPQPQKGKSLTPEEIQKLRWIYNWLSDSSYRKWLSQK